MKKTVFYILILGFVALLLFLFFQPIMNQGGIGGIGGIEEGLANMDPTNEFIQAFIATVKYAGGNTYNDVMPGDLLMDFQNPDEDIVATKFPRIDYTGETNPYVIAECDFWNSIHDTCMDTVANGMPGLQLATQVQDKVGVIQYPIYYPTLISLIQSRLDSGEYYTDVSPLIEYFQTIMPTNRYNTDCNILFSNMLKHYIDELRSIEAQMKKSNETNMVENSVKNSQDIVQTFSDTISQGFIEKMRQGFKQ